MLRHLIILVLLATPAAAQIQSRPTDPPIVTAVNESWYQLREPIQIAGELYYPAGPAVFFDGDTMVRTGHYNGVPLYTDATLEPFSVMLVPVSRGLLQPYERRRSGDLAGTTGSRAPSFPVSVGPRSTGVPESPTAPTAPPASAGAIAAFTPALGTDDARSGRDEARIAPATAEPGAVGTAGVFVTRRPVGPPLVSVRQPDGNRGVWIRYGGERWASAGAAVPRESGTFVQVGNYAGYPVFVREGEDAKRIYLPTRPGVLAPYEKASPPEP